MARQAVDRTQLAGRVARLLKEEYKMFMHTEAKSLADLNIEAW